MQPGKLKHRITIERPRQVQDGSGNLVDTWEPLPGFVRIAAQVLPDRAQEAVAARQIEATRNAMIQLRYQPGIDPRMRAVHHVRPTIDEYWDIVGVVPFQFDQKELRLMCVGWDEEGYRRGTDLVNPNA